MESKKPTRTGKNFSTKNINKLAEKVFPRKQSAAIEEDLLNINAQKDYAGSEVIRRKSQVLRFDFKLNEDNISLSLIKKEFKGYQEATMSNKSYGPIKSFGVNSYIGLIKETNEDKITAVGQIKKTLTSKMRTWQKMSYFGIFDGHGGESCSTFLRDNLLDYITDDSNFPNDMKTAISKALEKAEAEFMKKNEGKTLSQMDTSGSCALVAIVLDNKLYIANIGDSRAIASMNGGTKILPLSIDHKPYNLKEFERAIKNGSKIYADTYEDIKDESEMKFITKKEQLDKYNFDEEDEDRKELPVFREYPSDLSVMRTIGDIKAKKKEFGANPGSIISKPDIFVYDLTPNFDFIIMGCDGIYDDLANRQIISAAWLVFDKSSKEHNYNIHSLAKDACDMIIKYALDKLTGDNLSCIVIALEGLEKYLYSKSKKDKEINVMIESKNHH